MNTQKPTLLNLTPMQAAIIALVVIAVLGVTMIAWGFVPHLSLLSVILGLMMFGLFRGIGFEAMQIR